jgi:hypothetical protein
VLVAAGGVIKPNGEPYRNTTEDYFWLIITCAKAAKWLGYVDVDLIVDKRNDAPVIFRPTEVRAELSTKALAGLGLGEAGLHVLYWRS